MFSSQSFHMVFPLVIILIFIFIPLLIGSMASQKGVATVNDFFLYSRNMTTTICFFTVYATWWSSFAFLGSTSYFYSVGSVYWTGIAWNVLFGILFMVFGKRLNLYGREKNYITPIHFFNDLYSSKILNKIILILMIVFTVPYLQIQLYGGAIIVEMATNGVISWQICAFLFYLIMAVYLWVGGLRAVAWTDVFYGILIFMGMLLAGYILVVAAGGVDYVFETLEKNRPDLLYLKSSSGSGSISTWVAMFILMPLGALMGPAMWLRMFAVKKQSTFNIMPFLLSLAAIAYLGSMLAGSAATILQPNIHDTDAVLPLLLTQYASPWLMAIVMCCGAAACLSTANAEVHAVSALFVLNIYKPLVRRKLSENKTILIGRLTIMAFSAFAYLSLVLIQTPDSIVSTGFLSLCGMAQIAIPTGGALLWHRSNKKGAVLGILIGLGTTLAFLVFGGTRFFVHPALLGLLANILVFLICGFGFPIEQGTAEKIVGYKRGIFDND